MSKGISLNWVVDTATNAPSLSGADLAALASSGARLARVDLRLGGNASWSSGLLAAYTTAINSIVAQGVDVIGLLGPGIVAGATQAQWNDHDVENGGSGDNPYLHRYASAAKTLVASFPQVARWEIWNEPNGWTNHPSASVYTGGTFLYPSLFAALLALVYPQTKQLRPGSTVISGGLLAHDNGGVLSRDSAAVTYLTNLYDAGGWGTWATPAPLDVVGLHYYIDQGAALTPEHLQRYLNMLLGAIGWYERPLARPVYVTEAAWTTSAVSETVQAQNVTAFYEALSRNQYVQAALWFQLRDLPAANQYYGILRADGTPKPSFAAYQALPVSAS